MIGYRTKKNYQYAILKKLFTNMLHIWKSRTTSLLYPARIPMHEQKMLLSPFLSISHQLILMDKQRLPGGDTTFCMHFREKLEGGRGEIA